MAMSGRSDRKIKNLFINKGLQFRIIITSMMYMFLVMIITTGVILFPSIYDMFLARDLDVQYKAAQQFIVLARYLMPAMVSLFALFFIHQLFITHRICGPLVNFAVTFDRIAAGDLTRKVFLRKTDYLKDECSKINMMIEGLSDHIRTIRSDHDTMVDVLKEALVSVGDPDTKQRIETILDNLKNSALVVSEDISQFKIDDSSSEE